MTDPLPPNLPTPLRKQATVLVARLAPPVGRHHRSPAPEVEVPTDLWARLLATLQHCGAWVEPALRPSEPLVAYFGLPLAREDDPRRAIRAALTMQAEVAAFYHLTADPSAASLPLQVGLHTGPVLWEEADGAGAPAPGQTLALARGLMESVAGGGIVVTQETEWLAHGYFEVQPVTAPPEGERPARYLVLHEQPRPFLDVRGVEGIESRLIGRDAELNTLRDLFARTIAHQSLHIVTLVGEAGVGKSRLLQEFIAWVEEQPETVRFFKGRAGPQTSKQSFALTRDLFAFRFGIRASDRAVLARAKFEQGIRQFMRTDGTEKAHFIGHLLGFDFSESPYLRGILQDAQQIRERAFHYTVRFFEAITAARGGAVGLLRGGSSRTERPLALLLLEDIHWADAGSLDLLEFLVQACQDTPIMVICLARTALWDQHPTWGETFPTERQACLTLAPLTPAETRSLVEELLHSLPSIPRALERLIVDRADGNPFYVEELIRMFIEDGVIVPNKGAWRVESGRLEAVRVPPTLTGVLQARLDVLPRRERETLQRAAVIGRTFWDRLLETLSEESSHSAPVLERVLPSLQSKELVVQQPDSSFTDTTEYLFRHALLQDVAYDSIHPQRRASYHALTAAWLIKQGGERVGEYAGQIAQHYERAGERPLAAEWYARAARRAKESYVLSSAIEHSQRALALLPEDAGGAQRMVLLEGVGEVLWWQARYAEAMASFQAMQQVAQATGDTVAEARSWNLLAQVQDSQGDHHGALKSTQQAKRLARAAGLPARDELATAYAWIGISRFRLGQMHEAETKAERALALSRAIGNRVIQARALNLLGWVQTGTGRFAEGQAVMQDALAIYRTLGDRRHMASMLNNLGASAHFRGEYRTALPFYQEGIVIAQEVGDRDTEVVLRSNLGGVLVALGHATTAEEELQISLRMAASANLSATSETWSFLSEALLAQQRLDEAEAAAQQALELVGLTEEKEHTGTAWRALGQIASARLAAGLVAAHDPDHCFRTSQQIFEEIEAEAEVARTLRAWAAHARAQGDSTQGDALLQQARDRFTRLGLTEEIARTTP